MNYDEVTLDDAQEWLDADGLPDGWNWYEALRLEPELESDLHWVMKMLAHSWTTCACGQLCNVLPRLYDGAPTDHRLLDLGRDFYDAVVKADWHRATEVLDLIEERSGDLIATLPRS